MNKERIAQLLALVFVAGTTNLSDLEGPIEEIAQAANLSEDKEEKKALAAKFKELTSAYNTEAKSSVYHTDLKKVKIVSLTTDSKNPTPGEVKTFRKPKDLTDAEKQEILAMLENKENKRADIAAKFNVHPSTISDIVAAKNKAAAAPSANGTEAGATSAPPVAEGAAQ